MLIKHIKKKYKMQIFIIVVVNHKMKLYYQPGLIGKISWNFSKYSYVDLLSLVIPCCSTGTGQCPRKISMSWTCPEHYKVHVHGWDSPEHPIYGHCPIPLPALPC